MRRRICEMKEWNDAHVRSTQCLLDTAAASCVIQRNSCNAARLLAALTSRALRAVLLLACVAVTCSYLLAIDAQIAGVCSRSLESSEKGRFSTGFRNFSSGTTFQKL